VALIIATGAVLIQALDPNDPITISKSVTPFDVVIPGEEYPDDFTICIKVPADDDQVEYTLELKKKPLDPDDPDQGDFPDMRPYMTVRRDPLETDSEPDGNDFAGGTDTDALGKLVKSDGDVCDRWLVTLTAPHCRGAYNPATDPQGGAATPIPCLTEEPTDDPQTWITGSALGADVEITVTNTVPPPSPTPPP